MNDMYSCVWVRDEYVYLNSYTSHIGIIDDVPSIDKFMPFLKE